MAHKRTLTSTDACESNINAPPSKKQKIVDESSEIQNDQSHQTIILKICTKLGKSEKVFNLHDLKQVEYFKNQLSGRWNVANDISINCEDLYFGIKQIEALIFFKTHNHISIKYPYQNLIYLCNASDFCLESISAQAFSTYFSECIPAMQHKNLIELQLLCQKTKYARLLEGIDAALNEMKSVQNSINSNIINHWKYAKQQLLTSNTSIVIGVFTQNFGFTDYRQLGGGYSFHFDGKPDELKTLWNHILTNKLYVNHSEIIESVYKLKYPETIDINYSFSKNIGSIVSQIVSDTLEICCENDMKYQETENYAMIDNIFNIMSNDVKRPRHISSNDKEKEMQKIATESFFHYDFLFIILRKLIFLRRKYEDKFRNHFGNNIIFTLLSNKLKKVTSVSKYRDISKDIQALKVDEIFTKIEQYELYKILFMNRDRVNLNAEKLKTVLELLVGITELLPSKTYELLEIILKGYRRISLDNGIVNSLLKSLINMDYNQCFKLTEKWFPLLMKDEKDWIISELPKKTSLKTLILLIEGICAHITYKRNKCDPAYLEFINRYTNVWNS